jgi:hypothetical protein
MKFKIIIVTLFCILVLFFAPYIFAENASVEVTGSVNAGGSRVVFRESVSQNVVNEQTADVLGKYVIFVPQGEYDITIVPPAQSDLQQVTKRNQKINTQRVENFTLKTAIVPSRVYIVIAAMSIILLMIIATGVAYYFWKKKNVASDKKSIPE